MLRATGRLVTRTDGGVAAMQHFIHAENVKHFKILLETEERPEQRKFLQKLLADEEIRYVEALKNVGKP